MPSSMGMKRRAFIDTSAYAAFINDRDDKHQAAGRIFQRLAAERWQLVTTNFILAETHALLLNRGVGYTFATRFIRAVDSGDAVKLLRAEESDEQRARDIIFTYRDKTFSYTDAVSFAVMERLNIPYAVSFDDDFRQFGIVTLPER